MSSVTNTGAEAPVGAGAEPPVGEVKDETEPIPVVIGPALVADDVGLDALASVTRTDAVPDTGTGRRAGGQRVRRRFGPSGPSRFRGHARRPGRH